MSRWMWWAAYHHHKTDSHIRVGWSQAKLFRLLSSTTQFCMSTPSSSMGQALVHYSVLITRLYTLSFTLHSMIKVAFDQRFLFLIGRQKRRFSLADSKLIRSYHHSWPLVKLALVLRALPIQGLEKMLFALLLSAIQAQLLQVRRSFHRS